MSEYKQSGCCTTCDEPCFEVVARWKDHEKRPGEPRRLGPPLDHGWRVTFLLYDGTKAGITFCTNCVNALTPEQYPAIWQKVLRSWLRDLSEKPGSEASVTKQFENGLLCELSRTTWKEIIDA